jgi:hypothetical protein
MHIERRTSNVQHRMKNKHPHSALDVGRSMFDVHVFQYPSTVDPG